MAFQDDRPIVQTTLFDVSGSFPAEVTDTNRLKVDTTGSVAIDGSVTVTAQAVPADLNFVIRDFCRNTGSRDLIVDGSSTPVEFVFTGSANFNVALSEIRFVVTAGQIKMDGASFGKAVTLSNGVLLEVQSSGSLTTLANSIVNEDFLAFPSQGAIVFDLGGVDDVMAVGYGLAGQVTLFSGSGDFVRVTIKDDLSGGSRDLNHFTCAVYGVAVE